MKNNLRFNFSTSFLLLCCLFMCSPIFAKPQTTARDSRAVELTFLKSEPGQLDNLKKFIILNWFAMDKKAKAKGLMETYTIMDTGKDDGPWNVVVSVTYKNTNGYEGIKEEFEKIRSEHVTVLVDGKTLRELGAFVESKKLFQSSLPLDN
jgi:hypothetical protein